VNVALFDYGAGNLHSLGKAIEATGAKVTVTADWSEALGLNALVLPGVGAFGQAASALPADRSDIRAALEGGLPCLGICLGMQLLFEGSEESEGTGIGLLAGRVRRLRGAVVPQMGWNDVSTTDDPVFDGAKPLVAYYANSYVCEPTDPADAIAWSEMDRTPFVAAVRRTRTWGFQFHPEKSSTAGRRLIENWVALAAQARLPEGARR
jgi:glutamine amidotransferase